MKLSKLTRRELSLTFLPRLTIIFKIVTHTCNCVRTWCLASPLQIATVAAYDVESVAGDGGLHPVRLSDWSSWHRSEHADERQASNKAFIRQVMPMLHAAQSCAQAMQRLNSN